MIIGVSKLAENYQKWIHAIDTGITIRDLYALTEEEMDELVPQLSGILLSGGSDIHPGRYSHNEFMVHCKNVDERRDAIEMRLIRDALRLKIPVFGICRGQQMLNIAGGGTLYPDIPVFCDSPLEHANSEDVYHTVKIKEDSLLCEIAGVKEGIVNSAHHQALFELGKGLYVSAVSPDGIIEAIEGDKASGHPFYMAVQWHPERMKYDEPLSGKLGKAFIKACRR